ncbi:uncharacterized protein LOC124420210 [Lucilia cuprina]|uniref:uncharacterized protein LOC124420210 n=1 Tax=Lucilia cuprina TaxID=7375 RepID=UPI001F05AC54|nr:uncharacterized protein LOC124420210 [Lucilia cuprina]
MTHNLLTQLNLPLRQTYFWTDSSIVLAWLSKHPNLWNTFVANRVSTIIQTVGVENWYHVASHDNPADVASRGCNADELKDDTLWWNGPSWLKEVASKWPTTNKHFITQAEAKVSQSFATTNLNPLTPGHFLIGSPILTPTEPDTSSDNITVANRWQKLKIQHQNFCKRWKDEYLKELHKRYKWKNNTREVEIGDIVVIRQDNLAPNEWLLGRVTKTHPGSDGRNRVVDLQTSTGTLTRPITKIVVLPVN